MNIRIIPFVLALCAGSALAQSTYVDKNGSWRYSDTDEAISAFGINYAPMFAHSYRRLKELGIDHKEAIQQDAYHFSRLGLDAFRIHLWETEITDPQGNLLENIHLDLLDYTLAELQEHHIQIFLTPLGLLGNGYPDAPTETLGFFNRYDKQACSHDPEAIRIQANYLKQLMEHTNPYTGIAYKDDPAIIGIELNNEPHHKGTKEQTRDYIQTLIKAVRGAGFKNPLFYNMSQNPYLRETYYSTDINGFSFQWYPTGLGGNDPATLNVLPYVNEYPLFTPHFNFGKEKAFQNRARIIYEFGLSNTRSSYAYAPLAEALRNAGFQLAAYFCYDPMAIAAWNTEYPKHFMNLAHTPCSAIGLMIAAEAFRGASGISCDPEKDQALLNNGTHFLYSNSTTQMPRQPNLLKAIAGTGSSPIVQYNGSGAYFLDRLNKNAWRLEVMPDAIPLRNPYRYNPENRVTGIEWNPHPMYLKLPGLDDRFSVTPIHGKKPDSHKAVRGRITVSPGVYLLGDYPAKQVSAEFAAPPPDKNLPSKWAPSPSLPDHILFDKKDSSSLFFSHGSRNKANITWTPNLCIFAQANCYGWDPKFVQFGFAVTGPKKNYKRMRLQIQSLHSTPYPIQVELGQNDGRIFGALLELRPGTREYDVPLNKLKPVLLARHDANPSFLPVFSTAKALNTKFSLPRVESIRFTIGPGLDAEQKNEELGLHVEKVWLN